MDAWNAIEFVFLAKLVWVEIRPESRADEMDIRTTTERETSQKA